jgi:hypothetical protein
MNMSYPLPSIPLPYPSLYARACTCTGDILYSDTVATCIGHGTFLKQQGHPVNMTPPITRCHSVASGNNGSPWTGQRTFLS